MQCTHVRPVVVIACVGFSIVVGDINLFQVSAHVGSEPSPGNASPSASLKDVTNQCFEWCGPHKEDWSTKCAWKTGECRACQQCAASLRALVKTTPMACNGWCETHPHTWDTKCFYVTGDCSGCQQCGANRTAQVGVMIESTAPLTVAKCLVWCAAHEYAWEKKCGFASGDCRACAECGIALDDNQQQKSMRTSRSTGEAVDQHPDVTRRDRKQRSGKPTATKHARKTKAHSEKHSKKHLSRLLKKSERRSRRKERNLRAATKPVEQDSKTDAIEGSRETMRSVAKHGTRQTHSISKGQTKLEKESSSELDDGAKSPKVAADDNHAKGHADNSSEGRDGKQPAQSGGSDKDVAITDGTSGDDRGASSSEVDVGASKVAAKEGSEDADVAAPRGRVAAMKQAFSRWLR